MDYFHGTETILLVEDEELLRDVVAEMLGELGYRVLSARNAREAQSLAQKFSSEIHVLITDLIMPELDGASLAEQIRGLRPKIRVLFITGDPNENCPVSPAMSRLDKPFTLKLLAAKLHELLQT